ncbi:hypothetical protein Trydic_g1953 [Trypoxylus dichotomus]
MLVNLTDTTLPPEAISILEKGANFAVTTTSVSKEEIIANVEAAIRRLPKTEGVRTDKALKLKPDESLTIIQADKGNATVIINTDEYKQKIKMLLEPPTYVTRQREPMLSALRETNGLVKVSSLPDDVKKQVTVTEALPKRLYGLPKIHKRDVPLRPTYLLVKHLTTVLQPYIGGKPSYIRDSAHFVEKFRKIQLNLGDILVSFDVVSLFSEVPLVDTLRYIVDLFSQNITQPFKHCLRTSYFVWDDSFHEQTDGEAMGSPLSPVVANLFMEQFESLTIETAADKPTI